MEHDGGFAEGGEREKCEKEKGGNSERQRRMREGEGEKDAKEGS